MLEISRPSLSGGFVNWITLLKSLIVRDIRTRFAGGMLGYGWAILIPTTWVLAITLFFQWVGRSSPISADLPIFIATGMLPYLMFRQMITVLMRTCKAHRHLLTLGPTTCEDLFTAATLLELMNALIVWLVVLGLAAGFSTVPLPADPLRLIAGILLAWMLGASFGRLAAILADISDSAQRIVPIILRPLFWVSGIFFIASELPDAALSVLWFNPLLHIVEYIRTGMFSNFSSHVATPFVPIAFSMVFYGASRMIEDTPTYRRLVSRR